MSAPNFAVITSPIASEVYEGLIRSPSGFHPSSSTTRRLRAFRAHHRTTRILSDPNRTFDPPPMPEKWSPPWARSVADRTGRGEASKTRLLIRAALDRQPYVDFYPIDVSRSALDAAVANLNGDFPGLSVVPVVNDYSRGLGQLSDCQAANCFSISDPALAISSPCKPEPCSA